jgi:2'-5' RNA ligase
MSRKATARLFVAVDLPDALREQLIAWAREAVGGLDFATLAGAERPLRLLEADTLHLTLCFLGNRPAHEIDAIGAVLEECATDVGELAVGAPLWLPPRRPRTLAVEIHDDEKQLGRLREDMAEGLRDAVGWEAERRRFEAHVTVVRMGWRARDAGPSIGAPPRLPATPRLRFQPESVTLYRSWRSPKGATYQALASSRLLPLAL